jgi:hypothetical protein
LIFFPLTSQALGLKGYSDLPSEQVRAQHSDYVTFPEELHLEIVREETGMPNHRLTDVIRNEELKKEIREGYFTSLQVRALSIRSTRVRPAGDEWRFPYVVSVKHTQGSWPLRICNQGTIEVGGEIIVHSDNGQLQVTVTQFGDSQKLERWGRKLGCNSGIDLEFAHEIVTPELENWFNSRPERIQTLFQMAPGIQFNERAL